MAQSVEDTKVILVAIGGHMPARTGSSVVHVIFPRLLLMHGREKDHGDHVLSKRVYGCRRQFHLWPPTKHSLESYDRGMHDGWPATDIHASVEGGILVYLDGNNALRMKSDTIHEVDTDLEGFIVSRGYIDE